MPELPEVETVVRGLARCLPGRRITSVTVLHRPSIAGSPGKPDCLCGRRVERVFRRGKFIRMELDGGLGVAVHLRMTGWLGLRACGNVPAPSHTRQAETPALPDAYVRLKLLLDGGRDELIFRDIRTFGRFWCGPAEAIEKLKALSRLGPEPLDIDARTFTRRLRARHGGLKALLLNQEFLAGVGNIYADESLHAAGLHPLKHASGVKPQRAEALHAAIQQVLAASIRAGGSSIENFVNASGERGWFQRELLVYGRAGEPCRRCGAPIKRIVVGQRGTWFCPRCQKR